MTKKGHVFWNPEKEKVFSLLDGKLDEKQIAEAVGCGVTMVKNVKKAKALGQVPPGYKTDKEGEVTPTTTKEEEKPHPTVRFSAGRMDCEYTPIMIIAQQAAVERWHWPQHIRFEDFIDTVLVHFFKDRGITLQGYIVDKEVEAK